MSFSFPPLSLLLDIVQSLPPMLIDWNPPTFTVIIDLISLFLGIGGRVEIDTLQVCCVVCGNAIRFDTRDR